MLIMFRIKNFASFKDEVILDLRAVSYKDMKSHVINLKDNKVLKTLAIYGKNASGKSNLISALYFFESYVFNQFYGAGNKDDDVNETIDRLPNIRRSSFKLAEIEDESSEFEIIFSHKDITYQYGFTIRDSLNNSDYLVECEWLLVNDKEVFDREKKVLKFGKTYEKELYKIDKIRDDRLYIGTLDYFADGKVKDIIDGFKEYLKKSFNVHFELFIESSIKGMFSGINISKRLIEDEAYRKTIEKFVRIADVGIAGLRVEEVTNKKQKQYKIKTIHNIYNSTGDIIGNKEFDMNLESSGTIRYFSFIQQILNMIDIGGVFIVDELSARLHPVLTKFIIDLYQSENNNKAQLIFTTHDISLMNRNQFRRDEIAFVDKNAKGESSIYTLADIKARSDSSFSKDYLYGKYGAIPIIREYENLYNRGGE